MWRALHWHAAKKFIAEIGTPLKILTKSQVNIFIAFYTHRFTYI
jgi:hypothetical protein